ncbi:MAG: phosphatidylserine/phosphatidylglycerophosphate/cardiolipin synthase family protein [Gemmatimonadales bacterium]
MTALRPGRLEQDALVRALDRAAGARSIPGNRVELLFDGPDVFAAMRELIAAATSWVHLDNYIIRDDRTGREFSALLAEKARAGVSVRVSTDWLGSFSTRRSYWSALREAGVAVRIFNGPRLFDVPSLLSRNHRKILVADGTRAVIGGLCLGDEWAGDPERGRLPWRDTAVRIDGPAATAIDQAFGVTWRRSGGELEDGESVGAVESRGNAAVRVLVGEPARERAYRVSELLLATAAERVWITDAYLVAPRRLYRYLIDAAREGVDVRLLVPGSSDLPVVRNLTRFGYRDLLAAGVRIFEWQGPMLHAKTVVADNRWVRVGSSNLNHSSLVGNYELDVLADSVELADRMEAQFRRDMDRSAEVMRRPRRVPPPLRRVVPPALEIPRAPASPPHRRGLRERRGGSVLALRTLAASARLAIFGPLAIVLALLGLLFFVIPGIMAIGFGTLSLWLALVAGGEVVRRRADPPDGRS